RAIPPAAPSRGAEHRRAEVSPVARRRRFRRRLVSGSSVPRVADENGLRTIALNRCLALRAALWTQRGLTQLRAVVLPAPATRRRDDSLELLAWLTTRIDQLDEQI